MAKTRKETIEYDASFLDKWNTFCDGKGYVKRQASHAARLAFMAMSASEREQVMMEAMPLVTQSRERSRRRG